jgi:4-amino-4-deoxy-L-arabinose transferase-like glycosyltransferase
MFRRLDNRASHYLLLALVWAVVCLPGLGKLSLWDIDEGNNAEASQEMLESGDFVVPTFNFKMRCDKPPLLYWLQVAAYRAFAVNEFAARLPSALAALLTVFTTCELGRRLFGKAAGLLAGLILASAVSFCASAHFANPDALLNLFTALTLWCWWNDYAGRGRWWFVATGATTGLAVLAKGPVGLVLPCAATVLFLVWRREWRRLCDPRLIAATLVFLAVAAPWYVWVAVETKGEWVREFWMKHNWKRATEVLEGHRGPFYYYALALVSGFAPWCVLLGPTGWLAWRNLRRKVAPPHPQPLSPEAGARGEKDAPLSPEAGTRGEKDAPLSPGGRGVGGEGDRPAFQFLVCWFAVCFVFFSLASTKLPNYILPLYPATAVLTACLLDRWRRGEVRLPAWVMRTSLVCLALLGVAVGVGLLVAGGVVRGPVPAGRLLPGLERCAAVGLLWVAAAAVGGWCLRRGRAAGLIAALSVAAVGFAVVAGRVARIADHQKAARPLARALPPDQTRRDVRVAAHGWFQPSLVFYCRREVLRLEFPIEILGLLQGPLPAYVFLPSAEWDKFQQICHSPYRLVARHHDLYLGGDVVLVTNEESGQGSVVRGQ